MLPDTLPEHQTEHQIDGERSVSMNMSNQFPKYAMSMVRGVEAGNCYSRLRCIMVMDRS
jgi:hypothetical protein